MTPHRDTPKPPAGHPVIVAQTRHFIAYRGEGEEADDLAVLCAQCGRGMTIRRDTIECTNPTCPDHGKLRKFAGKRMLLS